MSTLFYVLAFLGVAAVAITAYAFFSVVRGYENEKGFHSETPPAPPANEDTASAEKSP